jgi:cytoskeletal protein RodZ
VKRIHRYKLKSFAAALVMFMALGWLTVSLPYVYSFQQEGAKQESRSAPIDSPVDNEEANPLSNSTEEKASSNTLSEELIHHTDEHNYLFSYKLSHDNRHSYDLYVAYHGEVQCPPPNSLS